MITLYVILGLAVVGGILLKITLSQAKTAGKTEVASATQKEAIKNVQDAAILRDDLQRDPVEHDRVQHRFERDE